MFSRLFGPEVTNPPMRDVEALVSSLTSPAARLVKIEAPSQSHFGGTPNLPPGVAWPARKGVALDFLARLSLAELQRPCPLPWLPGAGALLFFYDLEEAPWGYDPKHRASWEILHVPELPAPVGASSAGPGERESRVPFASVGFLRIDSLPSVEREAIKALDFSEEESAAYCELADAPFCGQPKHQVGGFPAPVQGDQMELECQFASNGLYCGDCSGYKDNRAADLKAGATAWRLLFQFDTDNDLNVMWGDGGSIYFWVREQEARDGVFANAWLILQCF